MTEVQGKIIETWKNLVLTDPFAKITATEIINKSYIGHSTFYHYFVNVPDIMNHFFTAFIQAYFDTELSERKPLEFAVSFYNKISENADLIFALCSRIHDAMLRQITYVLNQIISDYLKLQHPELTEDWDLFSFTSNYCFIQLSGMFRYGFDNKMQESPDSVLFIIKYILEESITSAGKLFVILKDNDNFRKYITSFHAPIPNYKYKSIK